MGGTVINVQVQQIVLIAVLKTKLIEIDKRQTKDKQQWIEMKVL